jgi:steroid delta-isomerase-like uncharacterized protein
MASNLSAEERIALQRRTVEEHIDGENTHEYDRVNATFVEADRAYYHLAPGAIQYETAEGVRSWYEFLDKLLPDLEWKITHEYDVPGCSIREGTAYGTHSAEFAGVPASGNRIALEAIALYIFDEEEPDKLIAERVYWDNDSVIRQMKGEKVASLGLLQNFRR